MNTGMLWYDGRADRPLEGRILEACKYYTDKYGAVPNVCHVNPSMIPDGDKRMGGLAVVGVRTVLPNHFWIGVEEGV